jgi:RNA polymerase sigma-70 factor (ECF subfamily)
VVQRIDLAAAYAQYAPEIRRFLLRRTQDEDIADELLSQVFECACRDAPRYEDRGFPVSSWLYDIARCRLIDSIRRDRRRPTLPIDDCTLSQDDEIERAESRADAAPLLGLLDRLSPAHRAVLVSRFIDDQSLTEVAACLGTNTNAVKAIQHRALVHLRRLLDRQMRRCLRRGAA